MKNTTKRNLLIGSICALGAVCFVGCASATTGKPVDFDDVSVVLDVNDSYILPVSMTDSNGFFHKMTYSAQTKDGRDVSLVGNKLIVTDVAGYVVTGTAKIGSKTYERTFSVNVTGMQVDVAVESVEQGAEVEIPVPEFYVASEISSDVSIESSVEYIAPTQNGKTMKIHGFELTETDDGFFAEIAGTYIVIWQAEYDGKLYQQEKTYAVKRETTQAHVLNSFDSPEAHPTIEASYQWHKEYKGEQGVMQFDTNTVWPQARLRIDHSITSYQQAGYKYVVLRMYFPDDAPTWSVISFGNPNDQFASSTTSITRGAWENYYIPAEAFYHSYAEVTNEDGGYMWSAKLFQAMKSEEFAVAYISDAWMSNDCPYGLLTDENNTSYLTAISTSEQAIIGDAKTKAALDSAIETKGYVLQLQSGGNWPKCYIEGANGHWLERARAFQETGADRYFTATMYMPEGMRWSSVRLGVAIGEPYVDSAIYSRSGAWVTHIIDLKPLYEYVLENDREVGIHFRTGNGAEFDETLRNVVYISKVAFVNDGDITIPESLANKITSGYQSTKVNYLLNNEEATLTDSTVRADLQEEINEKGGVVEIVSVGSPLTFIQGLNGNWLALAQSWKETGENRYFIVRMYFVQGMEWKTPRLGMAMGLDYECNSKTVIRTGEWINVVFDLKELYEKILETETSPTLYFRTESGANTIDGKAVAYVSQIQFKNERESGNWTGDIILPQ